MVSLVGAVGGQGGPDYLGRALGLLAHWPMARREARVVGSVCLGACGPSWSAGDTGDGASPIVGEGGLTVVLDGRLENREELEARLPPGLRRPSRQRLTDAQIVARSYMVEGTQCLHNLAGEFALVVHDEVRGQLVLARDWPGTRPLFYVHTGDGGVVFASEMAPLLSHPGVSTRLCQQAIAEALVFGFVVSRDTTMFESIRQVTPGTAAVIRIEGTPPYGLAWSTVTHNTGLAEPRCEGEPPGAGSDHPSSDRGAQARDLLSQLHRSWARILSDHRGPVVVFLSGGLDSTLVLATAPADVRERVFTLTLGSLRSTADLEAARTTVRLLGISDNHREVLVDDDGVARAAVECVRATESVFPSGIFDPGGDVAWYLLARAASDISRVVITGDTADEVLGGYWMHKYPSGYADRLRGNAKSALSVSGLDSIPALDSFLASFLEGDTDTARAQTWHVLIESGLPNYHLWVVDRCSRSIGLEPRMPFLSVLRSHLRTAREEGGGNAAECGKGIVLEALRLLGANHRLPALERSKVGLPAGLGTDAVRDDGRAKFDRQMWRAFRSAYGVGL